ncbi:thioesterase II family protein [Streptomyces sp. NPDC006463]|uniref:thioesterase II family protein n=1 Tax=Streptomyces sp. NPDC006463 TaxID=3364746 RepID=UPI0036C3683F
MPLGTESRWLRRFATGAAPRTRLLCLPHAGGSAGFFHDWGHAFGDDVEVLAVRYPGRQERIAEEPWTELEQLAAAIADELPPYLDAPLAIFGHSMGATLGYEITLRLAERYGTAPSLLMVSCRRAPHLLTPRAAAFGTDEELVAEIKRIGGTDSALLDDPALRELVLPAIRGDFTAVARYTARPGTALPCPVVGYVGDGDPDVAPHEVAAWSALAPRGFELKVLPGGHFYLVEQRAALIGDIRARLVAQR